MTTRILLTKVNLPVTALVLFLFIGTSVLSQEPTFIYRNQDAFFKGCEPFYPMLVNYSVLFEDSAGHYRITPIMNHCRRESGCNSCGTSAADYREMIASHLHAMADMGFNVIRLTGLSVTLDHEKESTGGPGASMVSGRYFRFDKKNPHCHKFITTGIPVTDMEDYKRQADLIEQFIDIIRQEKLPLHLMIRAVGTWGPGIEFSEFIRCFFPLCIFPEIDQPFKILFGLGRIEFFY